MEPFVILTGPTAVGKTALSLELAEQMNAEIVSADSRQVYRRLDVGTAKPTPKELTRVPHHFINELALGEPFSAGAFAQAANARIYEILGRGRVPLVVGGSTLYLHALQHGLADVPSVDLAVREAVEADLEQRGAEALYVDLERVDPSAAASMDATKTQRLVRALEVFRATGRPLSSYYEDQPPPAFTFRTVILQRDRAALYDRINRRVDAMLADGLLDEVRSLLADGVDMDLNPLRTIGYQEPLAFLRDEIDYDEMVRVLKRNTRRYAKRQLTWFRRDGAATWVPVEAARAFFGLQ